MSVIPCSGPTAPEQGDPYAVENTLSILLTGAAFAGAAPPLFAQDSPSEQPQDDATEVGVGFGRRKFCDRCHGSDPRRKGDR